MEPFSIILGIIVIFCSSQFVFSDYPADIKIFGLVGMFSGVMILLGYK